MANMFNPANPSDNPLIIRITGPDVATSYVMTYVPTINVEALKQIIRTTPLLHCRHVITDKGLTYESFNMAKDDLNNYIQTRRLPEGAFITEEKPLMVDLFNIYERRLKEFA